MKKEIKITMHTTFIDPCYGRCASGGYCAIIEYKQRQKLVSGGDCKIKKISFEIESLSEVLKVLNQPCFIIFRTTSLSLYNQVKFLNYNHKNGYMKKNGEELKHKAVLMKLYEASKDHIIKPEYIETIVTEKLGVQCMNVANIQAFKYLSEA